MAHWHYVCKVTRRNRNDDENDKAYRLSLKSNPGNGCEGDLNVKSTSTFIMLSVWPPRVDK